MKATDQHFPEVFLLDYSLILLTMLLIGKFYTLFVYPTLCILAL